MKLYCHQVNKRLVEYLYEELPEDLSAAVDEHIEQCPLCREEFTECRQVLHTIDQATRQSSRNSPTIGLLNRINWELDSRPELEGHRAERQWWNIKWVAIAATLVIGVAAGVLFGQQVDLKRWLKTGNSPASEVRPVHLNSVTGFNKGSAESMWGALHPAQNRNSSSLDAEVESFLRENKLYEPGIKAGQPEENIQSATR